MKNQPFSVKAILRIPIAALVGLISMADIVNVNGQVTLIANDSSGYSSLNSAGNWSNGLAPQPGNGYVDSGKIIRTPIAGGNYTFVGDSLKFTSGGILAYKGATTGTITINNLILDNGTLNGGPSGYWTLAGNITLLGGGTFQTYSTASGTTGIIVSSVISGTGRLSVTTSSNTGTQDKLPIILACANNTYSGGAIIGALSALDVITDGALGSGNVVVNGGVLKLESGTKNDYIADAATLALATNQAPGSIILNFTGIDFISGLSFDGGMTFVEPGTYGSSTSGATHISSVFSGNGRLCVKGEATLLNNDSSGYSSFNSAGNWSNGLPPQIGSASFNNGRILRTPPTAGNYTFLGDSLTILGGGILAYKGASNYSITANNLILDVGIIDPGTYTLSGNVTLLNGGGTFRTYSVGINNTVTTVDAAISGPGKLGVATCSNTGLQDASTVILTHTNNTYCGGSAVRALSALTARSDGALGIGDVAVTGGILKLESGILNDYIANTASLTLAANQAPGSIILNYAGTDLIGDLSFDGGATFVEPGTYGSSTSGATYVNGVFSGNGKLCVKGGPAILTNNDTNGSSFNTAGNWSNSLIPQNGCDFSVIGRILRTPSAAGNYIFGGDSLSLSGGAVMAYKGASNYSMSINKLNLDAATINGGPYILNGNITLLGSGVNQFQTYANSSGYHNGIIIGSAISGTGSLRATTSSSTGAQDPDFIVLTHADNTYSGGTTVGALSGINAKADGALGSGNIVVNGGVLKLESGISNDYISDYAILALATNQVPGSIILNYSGTDNIAALSFDGGTTYGEAGTYGSPTSGATHVCSAFSGNGKLCVVPPPIIPGDASSVIPCIQYSYAAGLNSITVPPGTYYFDGKNGSPTSLRFNNMTDFTIDATGASFVFATGNEVTFTNCERVVFKGAVLDRNPLAFSQGKIVAIASDRSSMDVKTADGYPDNVNVNSGKALYFYDRTTRILKPGTVDLWMSRVEQISSGLYRYHSSPPFSANLPICVGDLVAWRGGAGGSGLALMNCSQMTVSNVTIVNGPGYCFKEESGAGNNHYDHITVTYGKCPAQATEPPLLSAAADAFHSRSVRQGPTVENFLFEGMGDDGFAVQSFYATAVSSTGNTVIINSNGVGFQNGDILRFLDSSFALAGEATITSLQTITSGTSSYFQANLNTPVAAQSGWWVANTSATGNGFIARNGIIRNHRARSFLIKASDGLIENCTISGNSMTAIAVCPEEDWNEADYSHNLDIRNNTIINASIWKEDSYAMAGIISVAAFHNSQYVPLPGGHRNITIEGNVFQDCNGVQILLSSAIGVQILNNQFINPMQQPSTRGVNVGVDPTAEIWMIHNSDVQLSGNQTTNPGAYLKTPLTNLP